MAYEVIKRVGGRAYRYRVESYRDPETRRVRGKWTYLGRVEGDAGSLQRPPRIPSRERLLDAAERLLEKHDVDQLTSAAVAREAGVAYGTFYRAFRDLPHLIREALLRRESPVRIDDLFEAPPVDATTERARFDAWVDGIVARVAERPGLVRTWLVFSNRDEAVVAERQRRATGAVDGLARHLRQIHGMGIAHAPNADFVAYAIVALLESVAREVAIEGSFSAIKRAGIHEIVADLAGLQTRIAVAAS